MKTVKQKIDIGTLYGGDVCMFVELGGYVEIIRGPIQMRDGYSLPVGTRFSKIGGRRRSASYVNINMFSAHFLEYCGRVRSEEMDCELVVFQRWPDKPLTYLPCFWHLSAGKGRMFMFFNRSCSGRIVEIKDWEYCIPGIQDMVREGVPV